VKIRQFIIVFIVVVTIIGLLGMFSILTGNSRNLFMLMRGQNLFLERGDVDLGEVKPNSETEVLILVRNFSFSERRITGVRYSCRCISIDALPLDVPGLGTRELHFIIQAGAEGSKLDHKVQIFTDDGGLRSLELRLHGKVCVVNTDVQ
jgi:hypothetical protein